MIFVFHDSQHCTIGTPQSIIFDPDPKQVNIEYLPTPRPEYYLLLFYWIMQLYLKVIPINSMYMLNKTPCIQAVSLSFVLIFILNDKG